MSRPATALLRRTLSHNTPFWRTLAYAAAEALGLAIVMIAVQLWADVTGGRRDADSLLPDDYLIVQKRVDGLGSFLGDAGATRFSAAERAELESQPWARAVGAFEAADCDVYASLDLGAGRRMSTSLFLEAIPDEFVDAVPQGWEWQAGQREVPVIVSRDYLALYNFGYAPSRGMPQLSEEMVKMVPLRLLLRSTRPGGGEMELTARIAGFSSRLNTIAVPPAFMREVNSTLGSEGEQAPSRLIVKLATPGSPEAAKWLASKGYETGGDRLDSGRLARLLSVLAWTVACVGLVITLLALGIMVMSIGLMLEKNRSRVGQLLQLGFAPGAIRAFYLRRVAVANLASLAVAVGLLLGAVALWRPPLAAVGINGAPLWIALGFGVALLLLALALGLTSLRRGIR